MTEQSSDLLEFRRPDVEQYLRYYRITGFDVDDDEERIAFSTNLSGAFNIWALDLSHRYPYQLTSMDQTPQFVRFDPQGRYLLTAFDHDGDEQFQIMAVPPEGGEPVPVRTSEGDRYMMGDLSEDGERLYYTSSKDEPQFLAGYRYDLAAQEEKRLFTGEQAPTFLGAVSPEETSFVYAHAFANTHVVALARVADGEEVSLTPDPGQVHTVGHATYRDENRVVLVTNYDSDYSYVAQTDLRSGEFEPLLQFDGESVKSMGSIELHRETDTLYFATQEGVRDHLYVYDLAGGDLQKIDSPVSVIDQVEVGDSGSIYLLGTRPTRPANIYRRDPDDGTWEMLTRNRLLGVPEGDMVEPEVVEYESFDGLDIEALLFRPASGRDNGHTVVWPHGGPQAAERTYFRGLFQLLSGRGYTVFAPNFRGSTGYGAAFTKMVEGDWGDGPRRDMVAGIEWLFEQRLADRERLFVVGGSYGGYMTLLLAGRHPEYFRACVDIFGPSNLFTFVESVPDHWKPIMQRWVGDPEEDRERFEAHSPITYLDQMTNPMLVVQGANDPRVVQEESDQIVAALRDKGVDVEYMVLEDEGHGFSKKENEIKAYRRVLEFLDDHRA